MRIWNILLFLEWNSILLRSQLLNSKSTEWFEFKKDCHNCFKTGNLIVLLTLNWTFLKDLLEPVLPCASAPRCSRPSLRWPSSGWRREAQRGRRSEADASFRRRSDRCDTSANSWTIIAILSWPYVTYLTWPNQGMHPRKSQKKTCRNLKYLWKLIEILRYLISDKHQSYFCMFSFSPEIVLINFCLA